MFESVSAASGGGFLGSIAVDEKVEERMSMDAAVVDMKIVVGVLREYLEVIGVLRVVVSGG